MSSTNPYERMARSYAEKSETSIYNALYERPAILSLLPDLQEKQVLDAGCGSGTLTRHLIDGGAQVTGVDLSPSLLNLAREKYGTDATFIEADLGEPLDFFEDDMFDLIVSSLALHYIRDWEVLFAEFARILTTNGMIIFSTHHPSASRRWMDLLDYFQRIKLTEMWHVDNEEIPVSYYHRSLSEMVSSFRMNGFLIENIVEPRPIAEAKEIDAFRYYYLSTREHFVLFRLVKDLK